jgi:hypothetical protein
LVGIGSAIFIGSAASASAGISDPGLVGIGSDSESAISTFVVRQFVPTVSVTSSSGSVSGENINQGFGVDTKTGSAFFNATTSSTTLVADTGESASVNQGFGVVTTTGSAFSNETATLAAAVSAQVAPDVIGFTTTASGSASASASTAAAGSTAASGSASAATPSTVGAASPSTTASTTIHKEPTGVIIGGVIGGLVLISFLVALFFFNRRRNNQRQALSEMSYTDPSPDIAVIPFTVPSSNPISTFLPQNYTSNGQSLLSSKFTQRGQPSDPASTGTSSSGRIPPLTPPRPSFKFSSPLAASLPPSSSPLPQALTGSQTDLDGTGIRVPQAATEPSMHRSESPSPRRGAIRANARFLRHEDSGVRIPFAEDDVVELPPFYTPG